jgi:serine protease Do
MTALRRALRPLLGFLLITPAVRAAELADLLDERLASVVAVEFTIQTEIDRRQVVVSGTVVDESGTILIPGTAIQAGLAPSQLVDFKLYRAGSPESSPAGYVGVDSLTGFHFVRATDPAVVAQLRPVTAYPVAPAPRIGTELWGVGLRGKDEDFMPYALTGRVALITRLPNATAISQHDLGAPGLPIFDREGRLAGLALNSFGQNFLLFSRNQHGSPVMLVNAEESSVVLLAGELLPFLRRVPTNPAGRPIAWIGIAGLQPVDPEVAKLLQLGEHPGLVVSDLVPEGPAARAGLQDRDIILALDDVPLPRLKPDRVVVGYFGQQILQRQPGDKLKVALLRGTERMEVTVEIGDEPKTVREAERRYFDRFGFTAREFLAADRMMHRAQPADAAGAAVHFVKPNAPAAVAGLRPDDWIREIDGEEVSDYAEAAKRLAAIEADAKRTEFVLLTRRGGETQVLRIKLN